MSNEVSNPAAQEIGPQGGPVTGKRSEDQSVVLDVHLELQKSSENPQHTADWAMLTLLRWVNTLCLGKNGDALRFVTRHFGKAMVLKDILRGHLGDALKKCVTLILPVDVMRRKTNIVWDNYDDDMLRNAQNVGHLKGITYENVSMGDCTSYDWQLLVHETVVEAVMDCLRELNHLSVTGLGGNVDSINEYRAPHPASHGYAKGAVDVQEKELWQHDGWTMLGAWIIFIPSFWELVDGSLSTVSFRNKITAKALERVNRYAVVPDESIKVGDKLDIFGLSRLLKFTTSAMKFLGPFKWNSGKEFIEHEEFNVTTEGETTWSTIRNRVRLISLRWFNNVVCESGKPKQSDCKDCKGSGIEQEPWKELALPCTECRPDRFEDLNRDQYPGLTYNMRNFAESVLFGMLSSMTIYASAISCDSKKRPTRVGGVNIDLRSRRIVFLNVRGDLQIKASSKSGRKYSKMRLLPNVSLFINSSKELWKRVSWMPVCRVAPESEPLSHVNALVSSDQTVWVVKEHIEKSVSQYMLEMSWLVYAVSQYEYQSYDRIIKPIEHKFSKLCGNNLPFTVVRRIAGEVFYWSGGACWSHANALKVRDILNDLRCFSDVGLPVYIQRPLYSVREEASRGWQEPVPEGKVWNSTDDGNVVMEYEFHKIRGIPMKTNLREMDSAVVGLEYYTRKIVSPPSKHPRKIALIRDSQVTGKNYKIWVKQGGDRDEL